MLDLSLHLPERMYISQTRQIFVGFFVFVMFLLGLSKCLNFLPAKDAFSSFHSQPQSAKDENYPFSMLDFFTMAVCQSLL